MNEQINELQENEVLLDISELVNPFPGLRPFGVEEGHLFFGREGQSDEALHKLADNRFVAILGSSGSGKSSFVYCGLIPTLHGGYLTQAGSNWKVITCRPGGGPIDNLSEALLRREIAYTNLSEEDRLIKRTIISTVLRSSSLGLVDVIRQLKSKDHQNVLILVDQFEELFRFSKLQDMRSDYDEAASFVNLLLEATHSADQPIYVALTMRSDFIGECAKYPELTQMINDSHYLIPQMTRDQKRLAIEGPVAVGGGKIAPRLTQQLLNDVGDNPDQLPILQHALMRTWGYWVETRKPDEPMDLRHYTAIGTLREALSLHANEAYDLLSKREKEICEIIFKALTEKGAENTGIRRPTKLSTLAAIAGVSEDEVERVVDRFREPGRSLLMPPYGIRLESDTVIDISHESLMRIWDRLKRWLDEESKSAEMYLKLSEAAQRFQEGRAGLWQMPDLQLALNWREENKPTLVWAARYNQAFERTIVFIETSEKAYLTEQANIALIQKRKARNMRITAVILGAATIVCIFFVLLANLQTNYAKDALKQAEIEKEKAELAKKASEENEKKAIDESIKAEKAAKEADDQRQQALAEKARADNAAKEASQNALLATQKANEALIEKAKADSARSIALVNEKLAQEQTVLARKERDRAEQLRFQAIAQSMGIKAKGVNDPYLKGLVAKQGFDFYNEYKDSTKQYQGDIYAGVYYGLQGLIGASYVNPEIMSNEEALRKGDSTLNQYHGHKPLVAADQQVPVRSVSYSKDGKRMYSAGGDGKLLQWDVATRTFKILFSSDNVSRVVHISPDERYLALGTNQSEIYLFDLRNPENPPKKIAGHKGAIYDLVFMPDNSGFISVGADRRILYSDYTNIIEIANENYRVQTLAISPDVTRLASGSSLGKVFLYDLTKKEKGIFTKTELIRNKRDTLNKKTDITVEALSFSNDGRFLALGGQKLITEGISNSDKDGYVVARGGFIEVYDFIEKKRFGPQLTGFASGVTDVEFNRENKLLAGSSGDKTVRLFDMDNIFDLPTVFDDHKGWVFDLSFSPDGQGIVTACADGIIRYFPVKPDKMVAEICTLLNRNMSDVEWDQFVGIDIKWRETCADYIKPEDE